MTGVQFAAAVAARLDRVTPSSISVGAGGYSVDVSGPRGGRHASAAAAMLDDDDARTPAERLTAAGIAILEGAQDCVMELLTEQWPVSGRGVTALPAARLTSNRLYLWYEAAGEPVVSLEPLDTASGATPSAT